jgi:hypothetical protein
VGSVAWFTTGLLTDQPALVWTNVVLTFLNLFGVWRWLGREAQVEKGARTAARVSEEMPTETLFPVSLLNRASVTVDGEQVGRCVDAMAGCGNGRLNYLVVSEGGIAGVGEVLRRMPWSSATVHGEEVVGRLTADQFKALEELPRDEWPAR